MFDGKRKLQTVQTQTDFSPYSAFPPQYSHPTAPPLKRQLSTQVFSEKAQKAQCITSNSPKITYGQEKSRF